MRKRFRILCVPEFGGTSGPNACAYIRLILPLTTIPVKNAYDVAFARPEAIAFHQADAIITQRLAFATEHDVDLLVRRRDALRARLIYDIDDDLISLGPEHEEYLLYHRRADAIRRIARAADEVWASTETLRTRLSLLGARATTIPNALDPRLWRRPLIQFSHQPLHLLLMGTNTHRRDFEDTIAPAIASLRREFGDRVALTVVGVTTQSSVDWTVATPPPGVAATYPAFARWLQATQRPHIGLAPLAPSPFNNAKSRIKQLEYAALGAATIATAAGEYSSSITPDEDGMVVEPRPDGFFNAIRNLMKSPDRLKRLHEGAVKTAIGSLQSAAAGSVYLSRLAAVFGSPPSSTSS